MLNRVMLIGNLGSDPEVHRTDSGHTKCTMSVATNLEWTEEGERKSRVTWHRVIVWGAQAKSAGKHLAKGRQVYVEGRLDQRSYDDNDGNRRHIAEIVASRIVFLGGPKAAPPNEDAA